MEECLKSNDPVMVGLMLLALQVDLDTRLQRLATLHEAAKSGKTEVVRQHLAKGADVNGLDSQKMTALHWAARNGQTEVAKLLIANGANLNAKTERNLTPLNLADNHFHTDIAELLIAKGASEFVY